MAENNNRGGQGIKDDEKASKPGAAAHNAGSQGDPKSGQNEGRSGQAHTSQTSGAGRSDAGKSATDDTSRDADAKRTGNQAGFQSGTQSGSRTGALTGKPGTAEERNGGKGSAGGELGEQGEIDGNDATNEDLGDSSDEDKLRDNRPMAGQNKPGMKTQAGASGTTERRSGGD